MRTKDITEKIIGAAFEVFTHLGYGYREGLRTSMQVELLRSGVATEFQRPLLFATKTSSWEITTLISLCRIQ